MTVIVLISVATPFPLPGALIDACVVVPDCTNENFGLDAVEVGVDRELEDAGSDCEEAGGVCEDGGAVFDDVGGVLELAAAELVCAIAELLGTGGGLLDNGEEPDPEAEEALGDAPSCGQLKSIRDFELLVTAQLYPSPDLTSSSSSNHQRLYLPTSSQPVFVQYVCAFS